MVIHVQTRERPDEATIKRIAEALAKRMREQRQVGAETVEDRLRRLHERTERVP